MDIKNLLRAAVGQGLAFGWGDEGEAKLRAIFGDREYEEILEEIRREYGDYSEDNPLLAGTAEFAGGVLPGVAAMLTPGGQAAAPAAMARSAGALSKLGRLIGASTPIGQRSMAQNIARGSLAGATSGGIAGAGSSEEGDRTSGATAGTIMGAGLGAAIPAALGTGIHTAQWLRERAMPGEATINRAAARRLRRAMDATDTAPQELPQNLLGDEMLGVPSMVLNDSQGLTDLAEMLAQRSGPSSHIIANAIAGQTKRARGRVYDRVAEGLNPGNYDQDERRTLQELRQHARGAYDTAYAQGEIDDPRILEVLSTPQFKGFFKKAEQIANLEATAAKLRGEDPSQYQLRSIYRETGNVDPELIEAMRAMGISESTIQQNLDNLGSTELVTLPDVRTLDYIKRGIDATIDAGFRGQGMSSAEASALRSLRNELVGTLDKLAPDYKAARALYAGDMEVLDALRAGLNDFGKLRHEEVASMVGQMSQAEKQAFQTGVARHLYGVIMNPSTNANFANRLSGSPELMDKLRPLFESDAKFGLFKAALERESEIFQQARRVLDNSRTSKRQEMREAFEADPLGGAAADMVNGPIQSSLLNMVSKFIRDHAVTDDVAKRMAEMLTSKDPDQLAAVVQALENHAARTTTRATRSGGVEGGLTTGSTSSFWPAPLGSPEDEEEPGM